jgi:hypothetical protein
VTILKLYLWLHTPPTLRTPQVDLNAEAPT